MRKYMLIILSFSLSSCYGKEEKIEMEWNFPNCGISIPNNSKIDKICATQDFFAKARQSKT